MSRLSHYWKSRPLLSALLLAAVLLRALIPAGFMPADLTSSGGMLRLCGVIPTGGDAARRLEQRGPHRGGPAQHASQCPYAASAFGAPPPATAVLLSQWVAVTPQVSHPQIYHSLRILRAQTARAPPALS
jgi:hypothetical protein